MLKGLVQRVLGDSNQRELNRLQKLVQAINALEPEYEQLSETALRGKTAEFRQRLEQGETLDDLLVEAFAAVREAAKRTIGLRHFDVQLLGGMVLHQSKIAEMRTGEGKTLVATLPLYLNALSGRGAHLVTPNDYLSKVGVQWMGPVYHALGMQVGVIQSSAANPDRGSFVYDPDYLSADDRFVGLRPVRRREAYAADITYGTNNEFGFDYLRDNMVLDLDDCVQRELHYAIVDEVDNILIDEARTPLIISGPAEESSDLYRRFADLVRHLRPSSPQSIKDENPDGDYAVEEKTKNVTLTEAGAVRMEQMLPEVGSGESIYDPKHAHMLPYLDNALRAHVIYKVDRDYIVKDGEIIIVDEFTGRLMHGRRYSEGLHQAIEAKEGVTVRRESLTYATITFQNYFRMYDKLAGMTGTAATEKEEFQRIYNLDVVVLPTNVEYRATYGDLNARQVHAQDLEDVQFAGVLNGQNVMVTVYEGTGSGDQRYFRRLDLADLIYSSEKAKFQAVADEIEALHQAGRPVLVGTIAIETSERLSGLLRRRGIPHEVLNAKQHEREAVIIAQAGRPGAVTIATNMAGRGVDIKLGGDPDGLARERLRRQGVDLTQVAPEVWTEALVAARADCAANRQKILALGGLHILGTERHEARRIDNQLRGRAGRQGDPGSSRFYISLEDELMRRFGGERIQGLMEQLGGGEDIPIQHAWLDKSIEAAQVRVEGYNFDIRKHVLEFDDVVNKQREVIYAQRRQVLSQSDLRQQILGMVEDQIGRLVNAHTASPDPEEWDVQALYNELRMFLPLPKDWTTGHLGNMAPEEMRQALGTIAERSYDTLNQALGRDIYHQAVREDVSPQMLATSADRLRLMAYQLAVELRGASFDLEEMETPLRRLTQDDQHFERAFVSAVRLTRDRQLLLRTVDGLWVRHLTDLDVLREGIGLRAYGQQNPLVSYRKEAHEMYQGLLSTIQEQVAQRAFLVPTQRPQQARRPLRIARQPEPQLRLSTGRTTAQPAAAQASSKPSGSDAALPGRNDPCWCGSGKKYKLCHMRQDLEQQHERGTGQRPPQPSAAVKRGRR